MLCAWEMQQLCICHVIITRKHTTTRRKRSTHLPTLSFHSIFFNKREWIWPRARILKFVTDFHLCSINTNSHNSDGWKHFTVDWSVFVGGCDTFARHRSSSLNSRCNWKCNCFWTEDTFICKYNKSRDKNAIITP